jgi:hypothetical protein
MKQKFKENLITSEVSFQERISKRMVINDNELRVIAEKGNLDYEKLREHVIKQQLRNEKPQKQNNIKQKQSGTF